MKSKKLFLINLIYYIAMLLVAVIFVLGSAGRLKGDVLPSILIQLVVVSGIPILLYSLAVSKNFKQTFQDFGFKKLSTKLFWLSVAIGLTLYFLNIFVADSFATIIVLFGYETNIPALNISYSNMLKDFVLTACLPGLCEEILHRGMFLNGCKKHGYTRYGLIFSSILFGLLHLNILQFFYATILGFLIGISVLATESIWTGVICHFINNFLSVYFSYDTGLPIQRLYDYIFSLILNLSPYLVIAFSAGAMFGLIYLYKYLIKIAKKQKLKESVEQLTKELKLEELSDLEVESKINEVNELLANINKREDTSIKNKKKYNFVDTLFLYSSLVLGVLATIFSFITGIL